jgi:hypothetical protein
MLVDGVTGTLSNGTITLSGDVVTSTADGNISFGIDSNRNNIIINQSLNLNGLTINAQITGSGTFGQSAAGFQMNTVGGSLTSPTVLADGDLCGQVQFAGFVNGGSSGVPVLFDLAIIRTVVVDNGDLVSNFGNGKLQLFVINGNDPTNSKFAELDVKGVFSAPVLKPGVYADNAARDAAITAPAAGMIVFNTTGTKFQGYTGAAWVDLN